MQCANQIMHTIQLGDTLYSLAIRYNTTVSRLLELNPGVEIYNLQIGSTLVVCPGKPAVECPPPIEKFRELISLILCWVGEQFGEEEAKKIVRIICHDWRDSAYPCPPNNGNMNGNGVMFF